MELLRKDGFELYCLEDMSIVEQIRLFASARLVIGPHGAGLTNIIYCNHPALIELIPYDQFRYGDYAAMCSSMNGKYCNVVATNNFSYNDFKVSIESLNEALIKIELL
jgi:capsular polysaccharide biosynthesis protein